MWIRSPFTFETPNPSCTFPKVLETSHKPRVALSWADWREKSGTQSPHRWQGRKEKTDKKNKMYWKVKKKSNQIKKVNISVISGKSSHFFKCCKKANRLPLVIIRRNTALRAMFIYFKLKQKREGPGVRGGGVDSKTPSLTHTHFQSAISDSSSHVCSVMVDPLPMSSSSQKLVVKGKKKRKVGGASQIHWMSEVVHFGGLLCPLPLASVEYSRFIVRAYRGARKLIQFTLSISSPQVKDESSFGSLERGRAGGREGGRKGGASRFRMVG